MIFRHIMVESRCAGSIKLFYNNLSGLFEKKKKKNGLRQYVGTNNKKPRVFGFFPLFFHPRVFIHCYWHIVRCSFTYSYNFTIYDLCITLNSYFESFWRMISCFSIEIYIVHMNILDTMNHGHGNLTCIHDMRFEMCSGKYVFYERWGTMRWTDEWMVVFGLKRLLSAIKCYPLWVGFNFVLFHFKLQSTVFDIWSSSLSSKFNYFLDYH